MSLEKFKKVIHENFTKDADFIDATIKKLHLAKNSKILDIGTGFGAMAILLAINGFNLLTGQPEEDSEWHDPEEDHCGNHEEHEGHHHDSNWSDWRESAKAVGVENRIKFQHFNAESLPFPTESFDGIFMYDTLQHIKNRDVALNECLRVIKPRGIVSVIEWNKKSIEHDEKKYGITNDYINPMEILNRDDVFVEFLTGKFVNMYIIRKI